MNKQEFLQESDINILDYYVSDTVDKNGNESVDVILKVDKTKEEIEKELEKISKEQLDKHPKITFTGYEILLTKQQLQHLISEIENFEENGADYLGDEDDE